MLTPNDALDLARRQISETDDSDQTERFIPNGQNITTDLQYAPLSRMNNATSERGNAVLSAWRNYEFSRSGTTVQEDGQEWFGSKIDGPLWLALGVDKTTGQLRPPVANIPERLHAGTDFRRGPGVQTQVVNNFVTIQSSNNRYIGNVQRATDGNNGTHTGEITPPGPNGVSNTTGGPNGNSAPNVNGVPNSREVSLPTQLVFPMGIFPVREVLRQWVSTDVSKNVYKPLMLWSITERNCGGGNLKDKRNRVKLFSRRKVISIAFYHYVLHHSMSEYEARFTSISQKGKLRQNYEVSTKYIQDNNMKPMLTDQNLWISMCTRSSDQIWVREALHIDHSGFYPE